MPRASEEAGGFCDLFSGNGFFGRFFGRRDRRPKTALSNLFGVSRERSTRRARRQFGAIRAFSGNVRECATVWWMTQSRRTSLEFQIPRYPGKNWEFSGKIGNSRKVRH